MARDLLLRGMLAGAMAGLFAMVFAWLVGEPPLELALGFEAVHTHGEPELVSRAVQRSIGLLVASVALGVALGGLLALTFAAAWRRIPGIGPVALALLLAGAGFAAIVLVPQLKYPANPPSVGAPETIGLRTALYFEMILISLGALLLAVLSTRALRSRIGGGNALMAGAVIFAGLAGLLQFSLPNIDEVPDGFPADILWQFRLASLGTQFVLWAGIGAIFGVLARRRTDTRVIAAQAGTRA